MRDPSLKVYYLPQDVDERELAGGVAIVIDVLRATTTICQALAAGASEVVPLREVAEARAAASVEVGRVILGGERSGRRIEGFDLGNSPLEYTPEVVRGRRVIITTTNGTRALYRARLSRRVLIGAFVNLSAVVASVQEEPRIDILCAGTDGAVTREDVLAAGAMVSQIEMRVGARHELDLTGIAARNEWEAVVARAAADGRAINEQLALELRETPGGRNLIEIGLDRDLVDCVQIDWLDIVPELNATEWRITVPRRENPLC